MKKSSSLGAIGQSLVGSKSVRERNEPFDAFSSQYSLEDECFSTQVPTLSGEPSAVTAGASASSPSGGRYLSRDFSDFSVHRSQWTQHKDDIGRIFWHDRNSGISQWHVPNDVYLPMSKINRNIAGRQQLNEKRTQILMPSLARALKNVDCMVDSDAVQPIGMGAWIGRRMSRNSLKDAELPKELFADLLPSDLGDRFDGDPALRVMISSATGLRDADFMPGADKSDPYCTCQIIGKPLSRFRTHIINDDLNPIWNYEMFMRDFEEGDHLLFEVWDHDDVLMDTNADRMWQRRESLQHVFEDQKGDDKLGKVSVPYDDIERGGPMKLWLDEAGKGITAHLNLELNIIQEWPNLEDELADSTAAGLQAAYPEYKVKLLELPPKVCEVVSWDPTHKKSGYTAQSTFFGAFEEDIQKLRKNDMVEILGLKSGRKTFKFAAIGGKKDPTHRIDGKMVRYLYVQDDALRIVIKDGMKWRKVVEEAAPGFDAKRVCVYFDPVTRKVVGTPHVG